MHNTFCLSGIAVKIVNFHALFGKPLEYFSRSPRRPLFENSHYRTYRQTDIYILLTSCLRLFFPYHHKPWWHDVILRWLPPRPTQLWNAYSAPHRDEFNGERDRVLISCCNTNKTWFEKHRFELIIRTVLFACQRGGLTFNTPTWGVGSGCICGRLFALVSSYLVLQHYRCLSSRGAFQLLLPLLLHPSHHYLGKVGGCKIIIQLMWKRYPAGKTVLTASDATPLTLPLSAAVFRAAQPSVLPTSDKWIPRINAPTFFMKSRFWQELMND